MGLANVTDPNYRFQTDSDGKVVAVVSPGGDSTPLTNNAAATALLAAQNQAAQQTVVLGAPLGAAAPALLTAATPAAQREALALSQGLVVGSTMAVWGDSIMDLDRPTMQSGTIAVNPAKGICSYLCALTGQSLQVVAFATQGGARSDELAVASQFNKIRNARPSIVLLNAGANDIGQLVGGTADTCVANMIASYTAALAVCDEIGAMVVLASPVLSYSYNNEAKVTAWNRIKSWMAAQVFNRRNTYFCDLSLVYADRTTTTPRMVGGDTAVGLNVYAVDAIHPTARGSHALAKKLYLDVFQHIVRKVDPFPLWLPASASNHVKLVTNPFGTGTGGTNNTSAIISGNIAATLGATANSFNAASTITASKVARTDTNIAQPSSLGEWQQFRVQSASAFTKGGTRCQYGANSYVSANGIADITKGVTPVQLLAEISMDAAPTGFRGFDLNLITSGTPNTISGGWGYENPGADYDGDAYAGSTMDGSVGNVVLATYPTILPANATNIGWTLRAFVDAAVSDFTYRVGRVYIRPWGLPVGYCSSDGSTVTFY